MSDIDTMNKNISNNTNARDEVPTLQAERGGGEEPSFPQDLFKVIFPFNLFGNDGDDAEKRQHLHREHYNRGSEHRDEQSSGRERMAHRRQAPLGMQNMCKMGPEPVDLSLGTLIPILLDDAAFDRMMRQYEAPFDTQHSPFDSHHDWDDTYTVSDVDDNSLHGDDIFFNDEDDDDDGDFYFTPTSSDFPEVICLPPPVLVDPVDSDTTPKASNKSRNDEPHPPRRTGLLGNHQGKY